MRQEGNGDEGVRIGGYRPGALGRVTEMHALYYHRHWGFDRVFEAELATELSEFLSHFESGRDAFWVAEAADRIVGSISIDGSRAADEGARLRWFILDEGHRGQGLGKRLIERALGFCREVGHRRVFLWTFAGLYAARHLYERAGFQLALEKPGDTWGRPVHDQKYLLDL